ncbi:MAG: response regulator transcription factor, partial [Erysipelotrichia bacterium]|nr:response regulator transcription factor [Erysipelotrichia bacterium]
EQDSGIEISKYIWQAYKIPIIFLTSYCDEKTLKEAMCCEPYGYLVKPWKDEELNAMILMAINKHAYFFPHQTVAQEEMCLLLGEGVKFHRGRSTLYRGDEVIRLTGNEIKLLTLLSEYPKEAVFFERISDYIWRESIYDLGRLRTLVYRLRQKVGFNIIESVCDAGYKLNVISR